MDNEELHIDTVKRLLDVLNTTGNSTEHFFETVGVNGNKTKLILGTIRGEKIRIVFFVYGDLVFEGDTEFKVNQLLNTDINLLELNELLREIDIVHKVTYTPFIKLDTTSGISNSYGFMINVYYHEKREVC